MNPEINNVLLSGYCERTLPGLWQEPFNALTNLAFIIAGILALRLYHKHAALGIKHHWDFVLLIALMFTIGAGSALWHFFPTRYTILADIIPILLFINVYLLSFMYRVVECNWREVAVFYFLFLALNLVIQLSFRKDFLNGSIFYAAGWITLIIMGIYLLMVKHVMGKRMLVAGVVFTISLFFRTMDKSVCQWIPVGTHFIWHLLNAWLLYMLTGVLFDNQAVANSRRRLSNTRAGKLS